MLFAKKSINYTFYATLIWMLAKTAPFIDLRSKSISAKGADKSFFVIFPTHNS